MAENDSTKPFCLATFEFIKGRWQLRAIEDKARGLCITAFCRRAPRDGRRRCHTCNSRTWRANHPAHYAYWNLRSHAKARKINFELTLEEFMFFCANTFYLQHKGWLAHQLHIDRIRVAEGYKIGNIQILTASENTSKRHHTDYANK
jgi:hypothetical protein